MSDSGTVFQESELSGIRLYGLLQAEQTKGQTPGGEAWPFAIGRKIAADKGSESAATGRMRVRGLMGD